MPKIFLSHAVEDNEISRKLAGNLRRDGAEIWVHYTQIEFDQNLPKVIRKAIAWCDILILMWSKFAALSSCVQLEWNNALIFKKKVIPCLLDGANEMENLYNFQCINFTDFEQGYEYLAHVLNSGAEEKIQSPVFTNSSNNMDFENTTEIGDTLYAPDGRATTEKITVEKNENVLSRYRSMPDKLAEEDVVAMLKKYDFFDNKRNEDGAGRTRRFELQVLFGDKVIADPKSYLLWQQGGSAKSIWYEDARQRIETLNQNNYAGYADWRLPTLEEAMSLMKRNAMDSTLYLNPLFDNVQSTIWTSDLAKGGSRAWVVFFNYGTCYPNCFDFTNFVRAVRSEMR